MRGTIADAVRGTIDIYSWCSEGTAAGAVRGTIAGAVRGTIAGSVRGTVVDAMQHSSHESEINSQNFHTLILLASFRRCVD